MGQFSECDISVDCVVFARFYLEKDNGRGLAAARDPAIPGEEHLVAWTAVPLIKPRRIASKAV